MSDMWLSNVIAVVRPFAGLPVELELLTKLLDIIEDLNLTQENRKLALAAGFDLFVSAEYYRTVAHVGWVYCPIHDPLLIYPYTNACPRCLLEGRFEYHKANKPKSGSIGATTSRLLGLFIKELLSRRGITIEVLRGNEPIDIIFVDRTTSPFTLFFSEVKASPLVTLPLTVPAQALTTEDDDDSFISEHRSTDFSQLYGSELFLFLPEYESQKALWDSKLYTLGSKQDVGDLTWAYRGLTSLLNVPSFFRNYLSFWLSAFQSYQGRIASPTFWYTNGCGQPVPRPSHWPQRSGTGYESVSDGKTSVGMDRTDDIKKATYQVLKLGAEGKPSLQFRYKTGIVSNIHAVRHFDEYLTSLKDIIWTRDISGQVTKVGQLPPDADLFNLFDGIVSLTQTVARDEWVKTVFDF